ncbi:MAG: division/cell wall cluster transcriptional repressor MraZ [Treponema sp.]|jgi:MraZ protein|nr:division/cell wall cluster transcriptional repressor MraZ [Treponema sp.]
MGTEAGGTYPSTLDDRGRVGIPIKLREMYSGSLVITLGLQTCAWIMKSETWDQMYRQITNHDELSDDERELLELRFIVSKIETEIDRAGRIPMPSHIKRYAELKKDCMVLNRIDRLEVWDEELLMAQLAENRPATKDALKKLGSLRHFKLDT